MRLLHPAKMQPTQYEQAVFAQISLPAVFFTALQGGYQSKMALLRSKNYKITVLAHFVLTVYHTISFNNYR